MAQAVPITILTVTGSGGVIKSSYNSMGTTTVPLSAFRLINNTDGDLFISLNGVNNHFFIPKTSFVLYDLASNSSATRSVLLLPENTTFYIKYSTAPSTGDFYIEGITSVGG